MKIIITGATGSLGAVLTRHFCTLRHEIIATGQMDSPPQNLLSFAKYIKVDIREPFELPDADICIHTAALSDDKASLKNLEQANVIGTKNTVNATKSCKKFIHISSSSVYLPDEKPLKEEIAGHQNNKQLSLYGYSKLMAEKILIENIGNQTCFVLRPRAHYGPGDKVILPRLLKLVKNDTIYRPGKMEINVSLTNYNNVIHAIECCLESEKQGVHIYNIADNQSYVFVEVIRKLTEGLFGKPLPEKQIPILLLKIMASMKINGMTKLLVRSFSKDMVLDISKIKKELNYKPETNFYDSLPELTEWVKKIGGIEVIKTGDRHLAWEY